MGGHFGRYMRVRADSGASEVVGLPREHLGAVIGGTGLAALILLRESESEYDALGPDAPLVIAFGPLSGTPLTTSAKLCIAAKSPLTNRLNDALSSSDFAIEGKRTGFDAIVIVSRAEAPSVILIDGEKITIELCPELWGSGLGVMECDARLRRRFPGYAFALTGTAGEHGVRYAGIFNGGRHAGRGGLGAVLGSKRIKAIGVRGQVPVPIFDAEHAYRIAKDLAKRSVGPATEKYRELGTVANLAAFNRLNALPSRNFQGGIFPEAAALSGETLKLTREKGRGSCAGCTIGCEHFFEVAPGQGTVKAEYENIFALGPLCGISNPDVVLAASRACDELGLDTISAGGTIAFAMECNEQGLFKGTPYEQEASGLVFGAGEALLGLLVKIAHRRGALGDLLAEGSKRASERIGGLAIDFAPHVKGLEIPGYEPRALQSMALGFAVNARGADHNRSGAYEADFSGKVNRFAARPQDVHFAIDTEDRAALIDSLILCKFLRGVFSDFYAEAAELFYAVTGFKYSAGEMKEAARRIVLLKKIFNERQGWTAAEDTLPARFFEMPLRGGAGEGVMLSRENVEAMVRAYYAARGLGNDGRVPVELLESAGILGLLRKAN